MCWISSLPIKLINPQASGLRSERGILYNPKYVLPSSSTGALPTSRNFRHKRTTNLIMSAASTAGVQSMCMTGPHFPPLSTPLPVLTRSARASFSEDNVGHVDFLGSSSPRSCTHESQHDCRILDVPPPYEETPPPYSGKIEPATLAEYLFKFGFRECYCILSTDLQG